MAKGRKSGGNKHGSNNASSNHGSSTGSGTATTTQPSNVPSFDHTTSTTGGGAITSSSPSSSSFGVSGGNTSSSNSPFAATNSPSSRPHLQNSSNTDHISLFDWLFKNEGIYYLWIFMVFGFVFGFIIGNTPVNIPVQHVYRSVIGFRSSIRADRIGTFVKHPLRSMSELISNKQHHSGYESEYYNDPTNTRIFAILREAVVRESGGYVHRDLGILIPAPCGSVRGLGMIRNSYYSCQKNCLTSNPDERQALNNDTVHSTTISQLNMTTSSRTKPYRQDEILIRVPLSFQMTRDVAIETFSTIIPQDVQNRANMHAFDDSMYLTLLLAHERGVGQFSKWLPYIASLPREPTCGYSKSLRPYILNAIEAYRVEWDVDTNGWGEETYKALIYAERIIENLNKNFGPYLERPPGISTIDNLRWALCQVVSRGIAGSALHGMLRLVPAIDLINHDANAAGIVELEGNERKADGYFMDALSEMDNGTFVIRSMRHGRLRPLRLGQELMVNYNVPYYTPLDWFVYSGFVPPERSGPWIKLDAVLPPVRRDGPFAYDFGDPNEDWERKEEQLLQRVREAEALHS